jgi:hypothetical protein
VQSYQYAYFVRNNVFGSDLDDIFNNVTLNDPCASNPCLNGASCSIGFKNNYVCFCPMSFTGIVVTFKSIKIFLQFCKGSRCETYLTLTTPYCTICQQQAAALASANAEAVQAQISAAKAQQLAYQKSLLVKVSSTQTAELAAIQAQLMIQLNSTIQSNLLFTMNQTVAELKNLTLRAVSNTQILASNATFLMIQASSLAQSAYLLAVSQVPKQLSLFNDMTSLANTTSEPVSKFQLAKAISNRTQQATLLSLFQISTALASLNSSDNAQKILIDALYEIQILEIIVSQTIAFTPERESNIAQLIQLVTNMKSKAKNLSDSLGSTLSTANAAKLAAIQADGAQAVALQASIKAARLALCYPNLCMHGGLCAANPDNSSFTCFCSSFYKGTTCQTLKGASVFNAGKSLKNYESIIHSEEYKLKKRFIFKKFNSYIK